MTAILVQGFDTTPEQCSVDVLTLARLLIIIHRMLHELSFDLDWYETSLGHDIKQAFGELFNVNETSFIKSYKKLVT